MPELIVRTPVGDVLRQQAASLRVPTETGAVGLRRAAEPTVLAVEPGLILLKSENDTFTWLGTAGGLLASSGDQVLLLTPLAVAGDDIRAVVDALGRALTAPPQELEAREALERLERAVVGQMAHEAASSVPRLGGAP